MRLVERDESLNNNGFNGRSRFERTANPALVFVAIFIFIFLLHLPLLRLPYFWDEAGYYVPAARDILLRGSLIPQSTISNAHPPLVMIWVAAWWKVAGYAPFVGRSAMLMLAAFSLMGIFRLAERVANPCVAIASTVCTAVYSVFFAQSSMALVDLASAGFIFWGLEAYFAERMPLAGLWFAVAGLTKETAIIAPISLAVWEVVGIFLRGRWCRFWRVSGARAHVAVRVLWLIFAVLPLAGWYGYHFLRTGYVFGNPEFFRYNVSSTLNPVRFLLALILRVWQVVGYLHLWVLTCTTAFAILMLPPTQDSGISRPRIGIPEQMVFYVVIAAYVIAMALIGGAALARYLLPATPLVIILCVSTLWRRMHLWVAAAACIALVFVLAWFWNPPYGFSPEDNLAYRDYVMLHEDAEQFLEARYPMERVLTAWPASDEITRPWLGYITRPMRTLRIEDFSLEPMLAGAELQSGYDVALIFSTKYEPGPAIWDRWPAFGRLREEWKAQFFGYHHDLPPAAAARLLSGRVVFSEERQGQWVAVIEIERLEEAKSGPIERH